MLRPDGDRRRLGRVPRFLIAASARANYEWALRRPGRPPFIVLTEFPRSGGNWIRDMLGDVLQLPVPRFACLPVTFAAIIHNHDHRRLVGHPTVYVLRDGRDVLLSHFHLSAATFAEGPPPLRRRILRRHPSLQAMAASGDPRDVDAVAFYREWRCRSVGSRVSWGEHVATWLGETPASAVVIRYEDMHADPAATLRRACARLSGRPPAPDAVEFAIRRNGFERQTGRRPGVARPNDVKRQGLAGAWRTELHPEVRALFEADFGDVLAAAGYA